MDEDNLNSLIQRFSELKHNFCGVYAADNFPSNLTDNSFIIVNISTSASIGTHWILLCQKKQKLIFAYPLGHTLLSYKPLQCRIASNFNVITVYELQRPTYRETKLNFVWFILYLYCSYYFQWTNTCKNE